MTREASGGSSVGRDAALADALMLSNVAVAAVDQNSWAVRGITLAPPREGRLLSGVVVFDRGRAPSGMEGTEWGTARWAQNERGEFYFFSGQYDLNRREAFDDFATRSA